MSFSLCFAMTLILFCGCSQEPNVGSKMTFPKNKNHVLFAIRTWTPVSMTNQNGRNVPGLLACDASLIRDEHDLRDCRRTNFVIFDGFVLGNSIRGRYWSQLSEASADVGLPVMDTHKSHAIIITADASRVVLASRCIDIAHASISVDTNDFHRTFK